MARILYAARRALRLNRDHIGGRYAVYPYVAD